MIVTVVPIQRLRRATRGWSYAVPAGLKCQPGSAQPAALLPAIPGQPPSATAFPDGCRFHPRCPKAAAQCRERRPDLRPLDRERMAACHFAELMMAAS